MNKSKAAAAIQATRREPAERGLMLLDVSLVHISAEADPWTYGSTDSCALFAVCSGQGTATADRQRLTLNRNTCLLVAPGCRTSIRPDFGELQLYRVSFRPSAPDGGLAAMERMPRAASLCPAEPETLLSLLGAMCEGDVPFTGMDRYNTHIRFIRFLSLMLKGSTDAEKLDHSLQSVERTIAYIHQHYDKEIGVGELAELAHLGVRQYSRLFRRLTGVSPNHYLNEYRVNRAKEQLLLTRDPLESIAHRSGYPDEYYFIRRFKELSGTSPRKYAKKQGAQRSIVALQFVGELLALGLHPVASLREALMLMEDDPRIGTIRCIGDKEADLQQLGELRPDVIIAADYMPAEAIAELSSCAPTVVLKWDCDPLERVRLLAEALGERQAAEKWLNAYALKKTVVQELYNPLVEKRKSAAVLGLQEGRIWLFAPRFFPVFYETLGFRPPALMSNMLSSNPHTRLMLLRFEQLEELRETGHICFIYKSRDEFEAEFALLSHRENWRQLTAVREGAVSTFGPRWASYDASTLLWQMEQLEETPSLLMPAGIRL